jgi:hypothetical protein
MGESGNSGSAAANSVFRPSLLVNLQILFDEGLKEKFAPKTSDQMADAKEFTGEIGEVTVDLSPEEISVDGLTLDTLLIPGLAIVTTDEEVGLGPDIVAEAGSISASKVMNIIPKGASIELPGYRQAGTFALDILHRDLPIDPRVIRALRAEIHLGTVSHAEWANGMVGRVEEGGRRSSVLVPTSTNLVLVGMADTITAEFSDRGSYIHIEGRDLRGTLLDTNVSPKILKLLSLKQPIDVVVRNLVNRFNPQGGGIQVATQASEWPNGVVPSPHVVGDQTRPQFDADPDEASQAQAGQNGETVPTTQGNPDTISYWDLITNYCLLVGGIPYFVGPQLRIRPARSLFDQRTVDQNPFDPNFPYPFGGNQPHKREVGHPLVSKPEAPFGYRRMVFGKDIQNLKFERKLGGVVVPAIKVVSYDGDNPVKGPDNRLLRAVYPPETDTAKRTSKVGSSGKGAKTDELYFPVYGIRNQKTLENIAKNLHAEIGRQELGGSVTTKNLSSFGGNNQDPDLLRLRPGDPVEFRTVDSGLQTFPTFAHELLDHTRRSEAAEIEAVAKRLGDKALATAIVQSAHGSNQQLTKTFRVTTVKFDWSNDAGLGIAFDFQNFVEMRYSATATTAVIGAAEPTSVEIGEVTDASDFIGTVEVLGDG